MKLTFGQGSGTFPPILLLTLWVLECNEAPVRRAGAGSERPRQAAGMAAHSSTQDQIYKNMLLDSSEKVVKKLVLSL